MLCPYKKLCNSVQITSGFSIALQAIVPTLTQLTAMTTANSIMASTVHSVVTPASALCKAACPLRSLLIVRLPVSQVLLRNAAHQGILCGHIIERQYQHPLMHYIPSSTKSH